MATANPAEQGIFTFKYNDAKQVVSIGTAIPTVCIVVVGLRFLTRSLQNSKIGLDDWLSLGGLVCPEDCLELHFQSSYRRLNRLPSLEWEHVWLMVNVASVPISQKRWQQIVGAVRTSLGYPTPEGPASLTSFEELHYIDPRSVLVLKVFRFRSWSFINFHLNSLTVVATICFPHHHDVIQRLHQA